MVTAAVSVAMERNGGEERHERSLGDDINGADDGFYKEVSGWVGGKLIKMEGFF